MEKIDKHENFRNVKTPIKPLHQSYKGYFSNFLAWKISNFSYFLHNSYKLVVDAP